MISQTDAEATILAALTALNGERPSDDQIVITPTTPLLRDDAQIDSLELVSLIADIETTLTTRHGLNVSLADERAFTRAVSPYDSVETLRDFILELARG